MYITHAEDSLDNSDYKDSTNYSLAGLKRMKYNAHRAIFGLLAFSYFDHDAMKEVKSEDILPGFEILREVVLINALGLDYIEDKKFRDLVGNVQFGYSGKPNDVVEYFGGGLDHPTRYDAEKALAYSINSILSIEDRIGSE